MWPENGMLFMGDVFTKPIWSDKISFLGEKVSFFQKNKQTNKQKTHICTKQTREHTRNTFSGQQPNKHNPTQTHLWLCGPGFYHTTRLSALQQEILGKKLFGAAHHAVNHELDLADVRTQRVNGNKRSGRKNDFPAYIF